MLFSGFADDGNDSDEYSPSASEDSHEEGEDETDNFDDHNYGFGMSEQSRTYVHEPIQGFPGLGQFAERAPSFQTVDVTMTQGECDCANFGIPCCLEEPVFRFFADINLEDEFYRERTELCNPNHLNRKRLYRTIFRALEFGVLISERRELPKCAVAKVRQLYPSKTGFYMGFKEF